MGGLRDPSPTPGTVDLRVCLVVCWVRGTLKLADSGKQKSLLKVGLTCEEKAWEQKTGLPSEEAPLADTLRWRCSTGSLGPAGLPSP